MPQARELIAGDALKAAALSYSADMRTRVETDQGGLLSVFDGWFTRVVSRLLQFDPTRSWEDSVREATMAGAVARPAMGPVPAATISRPLAAGAVRRIFRTRSIRCLLSAAVRHRIRRRRTAHMPGRSRADALARHGANEKNVFDFAMYPALIAELRPRTIFEIGSGLRRQRGVVCRYHDIVRHRRARPFRRPAPGHGRASTGQTLSGQLRRTCAAIRYRATGIGAAPRGSWSKTPTITWQLFWATYTPIWRRVITSWSKTATSSARHCARFSARIRAITWSTRALPTISAATPPAPPTRSSSGRRRPTPRPRRRPKSAAHRRQIVHQAQLRNSRRHRH